MASDSASFIRRDFYVSPPSTMATPKEWNTWLEKDRKAAIQARRTFTKSLPACELPANTQGLTSRKVGGVWRQSSNIGYTGDAETGGHLEPMVEATQERSVDVARMMFKARGVSHVKSGAEKRRDKKLRRKIRKLGR